MKIQELIKWAEENASKEKNIVIRSFFQQIASRGKRFVKATTDSEKWMAEIEEYLGQLKKRGVVYDLDVPQGEPKPAESKAVLREDGVSGGSSTPG